MAPLPALASVPDLAAYLQDTLDPEDASALLQLRLASGKVRDFTHQRIDYVEGDTVILTPSERGRAFLPELPIVGAPTAVEVSTDGGTTWAPLASWTLDYETGELADASTWPYRATTAPSSWRVTYSHGFQEIPDAIQGVVLELAASALNTPAGIELERVGLRQTKFSATGLSLDDENTLRPYVIAPSV